MQIFWQKSQRFFQHLATVYLSSKGTMRVFYSCENSCSATEQKAC